MPTITNAEIPGVLEALGTIARCKLPVAGKLRVVKVTRALQAQWQDVLEVREGLVRECCQLGEDGEPVREEHPDGTVSFPWRDEAARVEFNRRWGELLAESFTHPWGIEPAHVAPVDPAHDEVTAEMLLALGDFFIEPEEDGDG